ncbi:MAG: hypothetical protein AAGG09_13815 [Pseudomonadota bacterium]
MRPALPLLLALLLALCACAHSPGPDLSYDPIAQDPAQMTVALAYAPASSTPPDAVMTLGARHPDGRRVEETFTLDLTTADLPPGAQFAYRVSRDDRARLAGTRAVIERWKAEAPRTRGAFSVTSDPCSTTPVPAEVSVWVRAAPQDTFVALVTDAPLGALAAACAP